MGLGFQVGRGAGKRADMAGCEWPNQNSRWASRWPTAMFKKIIFFTIKLTFFFHFLPHSTTSSIIIFNSPSTKRKNASL
ncbi:hypothetical protein HanPI659440_Chr08g0307391 [Helianthus annuus]|nr:hypothetical protein HanPI659440_Chr08g0307391 [Helianthus annuus]